MHASARIRISLVTVALSLALVATGCGSDDKARAAANPQQWANRLVDWFVIEMSEDIAVLDRLRAPGAFLLVLTSDESRKVFERRIGGLGKCSERLEEVGEPPDVPSRPAATERLARVYDEFGEACGHYERVSEVLLDAVDLMTQSDPEDQLQGRERLRDAREPSRLAAQSFTRALELAGREPVLRAAGLRGPG